MTLFHIHMNLDTRLLSIRLIFDHIICREYGVLCYLLVIGEHHKTRKNDVDISIRYHNIVMII